MNPGILYAASAYIAWGLFPLYFHQLASVAPLEVVMHRTLWSAVFLLCVLTFLRRWSWLREVARQPRVLAAFALSAALLTLNWLTYVWSVHNHHLLDASLGYFILPLVNVAIGFFVLHERPRRGQWVGVAVASSGVLWLAVQAGHPPWIALILALSFGGYGLLRKVGALGALEGLSLETLLLAPLAIGMLAGVIGKPDALAGEVIKAFVVLKQDIAPSEDLRLELMGHARRRLGAAVAPKEIAFVPALPHTRSGKIMRRLLKARELGLPEGDSSTLEQAEAQREKK